MAFMMKRWNDDQDKMVKNLSEKGGYLFIPERVKDDDESEKKQEKGIVLKIEKGGKISDAVLSFGYKRTQLDKESFVGSSITDFENRDYRQDDKINKSIKTVTEDEFYRYDKYDGLKKTEEYHSFDFKEMREISEQEFNKYKNLEEVRDKRYAKALKEKEHEDPLTKKFEYEEFRKVYGYSEESDEAKTLAKRIEDKNATQIIHNLYKARKNREKQ